MPYRGHQHGICRKLQRQRFVLVETASDEFGKPHSAEQARGYTADETLSHACEDRQSDPERVARCGMRIDGQIVEEKVGQPVPRQMPGYFRLWREHKTRRIDAAGVRFTAKIARCRLARLQQPQHAAFDLSKKPHPDVEELRRQLVAVVETTEHEAGLRQVCEPARRHFICD